MRLNKLSNLPKILTSFDGNANLIPRVKQKTAANISNSPSANWSESETQPASLFLIGQAPFILEYIIGEDQWSKREFDVSYSEFKGELNYSSVCWINQNHEYMLTGGSTFELSEISSKSFVFKVEQTAQFRKKADLIIGRFSHSSVFLNEHVYAIGGIGRNQNLNISNESTLNSWERYDIRINKWEEVSTLNTERSHFGIATFINNYIYWFGGFNGTEPLDSIEKYDVLLDFWIQIVVKLPIKISSLGVSELVNNVSVLIIGGIFLNDNGTYSYLDTVYKMDLEDEKIFKMPKMNNKRIWHSSVPHFEESIFAIGGWEMTNTYNNDNEYSYITNRCEKFDIALNKWSNITKYDDILPKNDLQSFAIVLRTSQ